MQREESKLLWDALECCRAIRAATTTVNRQEFAQDRTVQSSCYWEFSVIGEALVRLRREYPQTFAQITNADRIIGFRNVLVHGYDIINADRVWTIIVDDLPVLENEL